MDKVTSREVARRASVSIATVSRVLNHMPNVSPEVQDKVLRAAKELNYQPSRTAQRLRAQKSQVIGLIVSDVENPFFTSVVRGIEDFLQKQSYSVVLCNSDEDPEKELLYINVMLAESVAGVIVSPSSESRPHIQSLLDHRIPVVTIDRLLQNLEVDSVVSNNYGSSFKAVSYLVRQGHRRIGLVSLPLTTLPGAERCEGYKGALRENGIPVSQKLISIGDAKEAGGYESAMRLLQNKEQPTALFCANNLMTLGALRAIKDFGLSVPKDISLIGFDDMLWSPLLDPPLTCVAQPTYEMGQRAAELLLARIQRRDAPVDHVQMETQLILRDSVAPPNGRK
jgi:DNA-binding LacI/PurR family transcriptional regulator